MFGHWRHTYVYMHLTIHCVATGCYLRLRHQVTRRWGEIVCVCAWCRGSKCYAAPARRRRRATHSSASLPAVTNDSTCCLEVEIGEMPSVISSLLPLMSSRNHKSRRDLPLMNQYFIELVEIWGGSPAGTDWLNGFIGVMYLWRRQIVCLIVSLSVAKGNRWYRFCNYLLYQLFHYCRPLKARHPSLLCGLTYWYFSTCIFFIINFTFVDL